jgi:hypothetical protein
MSHRVSSRSNEFSKPDEGVSSDPIIEEPEGGKLNGDENSRFQSENPNQQKSTWSSSSSSMTASSGGSGGTFFASSSSNDDGHNRTQVRSVSSPTVDQFGRPVIDTITKTDRTIDGQAKPTETNRFQTPIDQSQSSFQQQNQPTLTQ